MTDVLPVCTVVPVTNPSGRFSIHSITKVMVVEPWLTRQKHLVTVLFLAGIHGAG